MKVSAMDAYKKWVRRNKEYVHSIETLANSMAWLLPERFSASEIGPEAVTAILGIITAINQHIIDTDPTQMRKESAELMFPWPLGISTVKDLETLVEVVAQQFYGDDKKWDFLAVTEATKALLRLVLLHDSGYKMLLHGGVLVNNEGGPSVPESLPGTSQRPSHGKGSAPNSSIFQPPNPSWHYGPGCYQDFQGRNPRNLEGTALSALSRFGENAKMASNPMWLNKLQHRAVTASMEPPAVALVKPTLASIWSEKGVFGGLFVLGEVLFIMRPLFYVLCIRKYGARSWKPWLLSLGVDFAGMGILSHITDRGRSSRGNYYSLSEDEKNEVKRRKLLWAFYLMRDPFFTKYTRDHLENTDKLLSPVPLVGVLTAKFVELIIGAQTRYSYTSAS